MKSTEYTDRETLIKSKNTLYVYYKVNTYAILHDIFLKYVKLECVLIITNASPTSHA